jgi:putative integral membrane protein (TIGR02587 family)
MPQGTGRPVYLSLQEYGRGVAGGLMFSLPLLYTMEVWWTGFLVDSRILIVYVLVTLALLLGYNRYAGMRPGVRLTSVAIDSIEEMGIGLVLSALVLFLLGRVSPEMPRYEILGKIVVESMLVSVGVSVGTAQLGISQEQADQDDRAEGCDTSGSGGESKDRSSDRSGIVAPLVLGVCGSILFAANVAPTEEIVVIATEASSWKLAALAAVSLAIGWLVLHFSNFHGTPQNLPPRSVFVRLSETAAYYALALAVSALTLWFFRRLDGVSLGTAIAEIVVLGFAGILGASAGRLLIQ